MDNLFEWINYSPFRQACAWGVVLCGSGSFVKYVIDSANDTIEEYSDTMTGLYDLVLRVSKGYCKEYSEVKVEPDRGDFSAIEMKLFKNESGEETFVPDFD